MTGSEVLCDVDLSHNRLEELRLHNLDIQHIFFVTFSNVKFMS